MIGITALGAAFGLAALLLVFGELEPLLKPRYALTINTTNAAGLRDGSPIELNGVPIGVVDHIGIRQDPQYPVEILALISTSQQIPADAIPYATSSLLGGSATLQLEVNSNGTDSPQDVLPSDGTAVINGVIRSRLIEQITAELDTQMAPLLEALSDFQRLSATYITLGENLNALVQPSDPNAPGPNIRTTVEKLNTVLDSVHDTLELAKQWLGDEQLQADAHEAIRNANLLIEQAAETLSQYGRLAGTLEADAQSVMTRLMPVLDELASTLEGVRGLTRRATEGKGTIAQLLNNPDLYESLTDAATRLERVLIEMQLLAEKIKTEGLPVQW